jgi:HNH endonuclease
MSSLSYVIRQLVVSNLSWFLESRNTVGESAGRERAVTINKSIFSQWFPTLTEAERLVEKKVDVKCRYYPATSDGLADMYITEPARPIRLQGGDKNWRLAGDAIPGNFYGTIRSGDLMVMVFDQDTRTLSWLCIRGFDGQPHRPVPDTECEVYQNILNLLGPPKGSMWQLSDEQALDVIEQVKLILPGAEELLMQSELLSQNTELGLQYINSDEAAPLPGLELPDYFPIASDRRQKAMREIRLRRGQPAFRRKLRQRYGDQCMISGCNLIDVVEAAHISPYRGQEDNDPSNGLLLRADLLTIFDLDLLGIQPGSLEIQLHPVVVAAGYGDLNHGLLICPNSDRPSHAALASRWVRFQMRLRA